MADSGLTSWCVLFCIHTLMSSGSCTGASVPSAWLGASVPSAWLGFLFLLLLLIISSLGIRVLRIAFLSDRAFSPRLPAVCLSVCLPAAAPAEQVQPTVVTYSDP